MTDFRGNIDHWIRQSEPDYFLFFLKTWIPFNAWYVAEMPQHNKKDIAIIRDLQDLPESKPRQRIEALLVNDTYEGKVFRHHLASLHFELESKTVLHDGKKLSFTNISLSKNPKVHSNYIDKNENKYKAERKPTFYEALIIDKNGKTRLHYKKPRYDINDLRHDIGFISLNDSKIQDNILKCFEDINPDRPISLVTNAKKKKEYLLLESEKDVKLINDPTTIAKASINMLYILRCMLFHGEISPMNSNKSIYEHSYYLLRLIIKHLM